jgi:hypothetical protein
MLSLLVRKNPSYTKLKYLSWAGLLHIYCLLLLAGPRDINSMTPVVILLIIRKMFPKPGPKDINMISPKHGKITRKKYQKPGLQTIMERNPLLGQGIIQALCPQLGPLIIQAQFPRSGQVLIKRKNH